MANKFIILADIELNINDEYHRSVDNVFVQVVDAPSADEALTQCPYKKGSTLEGGTIDYIRAKEIK